MCIRDREGAGAYFGLAKVTNDGELSSDNPPPVPSSVTYTYIGDEEEEEEGLATFMIATLLMATVYGCLYLSIKGIKLAVDPVMEPAVEMVMEPAVEMVDNNSIFHNVDVKVHELC